MPYMQRNWTVHLAIDNQDFGFWAVKEGGGIETEDSTYDDWDGQIQLGGKRTRTEITLRKLYREQVHAVFRTLDALAGRGNAVLTSSPTDDDGVSWGNPIINTGKLGNVAPPDVDKSSSDGGELEIVVRPHVALA
jgi:hypothetical protein